MALGNGGGGGDDEDNDGKQETLYIHDEGEVFCVCLF